MSMILYDEDDNHWYAYLTDGDLEEPHATEDHNYVGSGECVADVALMLISAMQEQVVRKVNDTRAELKRETRHLEELQIAAMASATRLEEIAATSAQLPPLPKEKPVRTEVRW